MNIFVLDSDPAVAATLLCDQHVGKMLLEACQLLCNAYPEPTGSLRQQWLDSTPQERSRLALLPYQHTHVKHPCSLWASTAMCNWVWLYQHALTLWHEYRHRFDREHGASCALLWISKRYAHVQPGLSTPFAQAMPEQYRGPDAVQAYRRYYAAEKRVLRGKPVTWTRRPRPNWFDKLVATASTYVSVSAALSAELSESEYRQRRTVHSPAHRPRHLPIPRPRLT